MGRSRWGSVRKADDHGALANQVLTTLKAAAVLD